jgi:glycosyltransferase involved in cell wall biosynthesis
MTRARASDDRTVSDEPLVTLIIPAYQAERFLHDALQSARAQTYGALEVIVVDDGSTDGTAAVTALFPEVVCLRLDTNEGSPVARNAGFQRARGEFIAFLDADDLMTPDRIAVQARWLEEHPECGCVLARQEPFFESGATLPAVESVTDLQGDPVVLLSAPMVRRSAIESVGGFDVSYRVVEDLDFLRRLVAAGVTVKVLDEILVRRRFHGANLSYDGDAIRQGMLRTVRSQIKGERAHRRDDSG